MPRRWVIAKVLVWIACLAPLAILFLRLYAVAGSSLGANPVDELLDTCGKTGLNLLILTLCITPVRRANGIPRLVSVRRLLGLFAFFYLVVHFVIYLTLDRALAWGTIGEDIAERPYITVGFSALILLIPLAITSTSGWQRRLKQRWTKLHRLIYAIAALGVLHFWWQVKLDSAEPLLYALILTLLLGVRAQHALKLRGRASVDPKTAVAAPHQRVEPPEAGNEPRKQRD